MQGFEQVTASLPSFLLCVVGGGFGVFCQSRQIGIPNFHLFLGKKKKEDMEFLILDATYDHILKFQDSRFIVACK